jgi:hypothetical protein
LCLTPCSGLTNANAAFLLTAAAGGASVTGTGTVDVGACNYDYLAIPGAQNQASPFAVADRYCGGTLPSVCSMLLIVTYL